MVADIYENHTDEGDRGQLYSYFDNKPLFMISLILFEVGSAICGAAPTINTLIGGRAICGVGGMGIYLGTMNMVSALTDERERPMYLGLVGLTWGIGTAYVFKIRITTCLPSLTMVTDLVL